MLGRRWRTRGAFRRPPGPPFVLLLVLLVLAAVFVLVEWNIRPTLLAIAEAKAIIIATEAVNRAIEQTVVRDVRYEDLIYVDKDDRGRVVLMKPNTLEINRVAARTTIAVQEELKKMTGRGFDIPAGQVMGSKLLANLGPRIPVTIVPIGTVNVSLYQTFEAAGINQTRHTVFLDTVATVKVVIPLLGGVTEVATTIPVAEVIIVGEVPTYYLQWNWGAGGWGSGTPGTAPPRPGDAGPLLFPGQELNPYRLPLPPQG